MVRCIDSGAKQVNTPDFPLNNSHVILGKSMNLSVLQFLHLQNGTQTQSCCEDWVNVYIYIYKALSACYKISALELWAIICIIIIIFDFFCLNLLYFNLLETWAGMRSAIYWDPPTLTSNSYVSLRNLTRFLESLPFCLLLLVPLPDEIWKPLRL